LEDIKCTLDSLNVDSKNKILVAHDWGCFYGYMFDEKNPGYFKQLIMLDVSGKV
jgi:pimeloyl-ACP methyl ester carboxylesterase